MGSGEEAQYVRCRRCHGTFESTLANCPRCGLAYQAGSEVQTEAGSYVDRYQGTDFAEPPAAAPPSSGSRRNNAVIWLALGAALIVTAILVGAVVVVGGLTAATPTPTSNNIVISRSTPTPNPTFPPAISQTLAQLSDPNLNLHVSIKTTMTLDARAAINHKSSSATVSTEVDCASGNESGTIKIGGASSEFRLVDGVFYTRALPSGKWAAHAGMSPYIILSPMFQLTEPKMLQYDGAEQQSGILADKLETTGWWNPDTGKLSGLDIGTLGISPAHTKLFLWVDSGGTPVYATFRAWTDASDGTNLLDISTTYTFTNVGTVEAIKAPI
jgi:hypothetical protein